MNHNNHERPQKWIEMLEWLQGDIKLNEPEKLEIQAYLQRIIDHYRRELKNNLNQEPE